MNRIIFILTLSAFLFSQQAEVTNIQADQRTDGSKIVDISYEILEDEVFESFNVIIELSLDEGNTYISLENATGNIGYGCLSGINYVEWDFGSQFDNLYTDTVIYKISATSSAIINNNQDLPFEFIEIEQGQYVSGLTPTITSIIPYDYEIMKFPVTNAEYASFLINALEENYIQIDSPGPFGFVTGPYYGIDFEQSDNYIYLSLKETKIRWDGNTFSVLEGFGNHPVMGIYWVGAWGFSAYYGLELPTENEWEKAARGMNPNNYPWGNNTDYCQYGQFEDWGNCSNAAWHHWSAPVGSYNGEDILSPEFSELLPGQPCMPETGWNAVYLLGCDMNCNINIEGLGYEGGDWSASNYCNDLYDCQEYAFSWGNCGESSITCEDVGLSSDCSGNCLINDLIGNCLNYDGFCIDGGFAEQPECMGLNFNCEEWNYDMGDCGRFQNQRDQSSLDSASPFGVYDLIGNGSEYIKNLSFDTNLSGIPFVQLKGTSEFGNGGYGIDYIFGPENLMNPIHLSDLNFDNLEWLPFSDVSYMMKTTFRCVKTN